MNGEQPMGEIPLDADAEAMLVALRAEDALPQEVQRRVWARLETDIQRGHGTRWAAIATGVLAVAAVVAIVLAGAEVLKRRDSAEPQTQAEYERAPTTSTGKAVEGRRSAPLHEPKTPQPEEKGAEEDSQAVQESDSHRACDEAPSARNGTGRGSSSPRAQPDEPTRPTKSDSVREETMLMGAVQDALVGGNPKRALAVVERWEARFPKGQLAQERSALRVVALCDAGRRNEGRKAAAAFLHLYPTHALAERVRAACPQKPRNPHP